MIDLVQSSTQKGGTQECVRVLWGCKMQSGDGGRQRYEP